MSGHLYDDEQCIDCGCWFGVPAGFQSRRRQDKRSFYCPNGHSMAYTVSEADKLRRERDRLQQDTARLEDEKREARSQAAANLERAQKAEAATQRLKKRTSAGSCPCCKRTFSNMAEHMKHQHPEFVADGGAKVVPIKRKRA